jgi:hypothetical protein
MLACCIQKQLFPIATMITHVHRVYSWPIVHRPCRHHACRIAFALLNYDAAGEPAAEHPAPVHYSSTRSHSEWTVSIDAEDIGPRALYTSDRFGIAARPTYAAAIRWGAALLVDEDIGEVSYLSPDEVINAVKKRG